MLIQKDHPLRQQLHEEVHARPFVATSAPEAISHIAMFCGEDTAAADQAHLYDLCDRFGITPPTGGNFFHADFGPFSLRWERHTEFCTYTFHQQAPEAVPFQTLAVDRVPEDWINSLPGQCLVAIHVALQKSQAEALVNRQLASLLGGGEVIGSIMSSGAKVWTTFQLCDDGFSRIIVEDAELSPFQLGRLVQRLLEVETYRMMSLLALPLAQDTARDIAHTHKELRDIIRTVSKVADVTGERKLLIRLSELATHVAQLNSKTDYRFSATHAYYALVQSRLQELREERIDGLQTLTEFMDRRLTPAYKTCQSVEDRKSRLSNRITSTSDLLRTGVDISLEEQNHALLASMNRRALLQLRLQQTVEGLSVAAISYYLVGLIGYGLDALHTPWPDINSVVIKGISVPVVVLLVWMATRAVKNKVAAADAPKT